MTSKVEIWSQASLEIGAGEISSTDESSTAAKACRARWDTLYESRLATHRWGIARTQEELSELTDPPEFRWSSRYQIPSNAVSIWSIYPRVDYQIYGKEIFADVSQLKLEYNRKPDEGDLPEYLVNALVLELASVIAFPVTRNASLRTELRVASAQEWVIARAVESQQSSTEQVVDSPIWAARNYG